MTTAISIRLLWHAGKQPDVSWAGRTFFGSLFLGWDIFNLVEGVIDHHILGIHHVVERPGLSMYDYRFLASGAVFIIMGLGFIRSGSKDVLPAHSTTDYEHNI